METVELERRKIPATLTPERLPDVATRTNAPIAPEIYTGKTREIVFEPIAPDDYKLSYACLIIPKFPSHRLLGDMARDMPEMLLNICQSFNWVLERTHVEPEYLQWILHVSPETASAHFMKVIRKASSDFLFKDYPALKETNLSKDFWAPGYFVIVSSQPHPAHMVIEYIRMTRRQQGF